MRIAQYICLDNMPDFLRSDHTYLLFSTDDHFPLLSLDLA